MSNTDPEADLFDLDDEYCHSGMLRRDFLLRAAAPAAVAGLSQS